MECKSCRQPIVEDRYRLVAEWPFCLECFERLRNRPEPKVAPPAEAPAHDGGGAHAEAVRVEPARGVSVRAEKTPTCAACQAVMTAADQAQMGQLGICIKCRHELIVRPFQKVLEREAEADEAAAEEEQEARDAAAVPTPSDEIFTPGTFGKKRCAACDRRLLEPSGYRVIDGSPYCPSCAGDAQAKAQAAAQAAFAAAAPARSAGPAQAACDACERPFGPVEPVVVEGFSICRACIGVDLEAALSIARARHKARLRKLREELAG